VQRVPRRAWRWQAGGRLRISGGGLSRIPLSLGIALGQGTLVESARAHDVQPGGVVVSESSLSRWAAGESLQRLPPPGPGSAGRGDG
jgi:hypothetical protein